MNLNLLATALVSTPFWLASVAIAANANPIERLRETNQCPNCDLSGADLAEMNLFGANLVNANLRGANLNGANLGSANLTDADLTGATLRNAYLYQATLDSANLTQVDLSNAYLREAILSDVNLAQAKLQGVNLSRTNLAGLDLQGVDLSGANLARATLSGMGANRSAISPAIFTSGSYLPEFLTYSFCSEPRPGGLDDIAKEQLTAFGIAFANLEGANLSGANLSGAIAIAANLKNANLSDANLSNACLTHAQLNNATLDGANLQDARLDEAILGNASLTDVKNADLSGAYRTEREAQLAPARSEARNNIGAMNRAQQAYYLDGNRFAAEIDTLGIGIRPETEFYRYEIIPQADSSKSVMMVARAKVEGLKSYTGAVFIVESEDYPMSITQICETEQPSTEPPAMPRLVDTEIECAAGSVALQ